MQVAGGLLAGAAAVADYLYQEDYRRPAFIGALGEAAEILAGRAGTRIDP